MTGVLHSVLTLLVLFNISSCYLVDYGPDTFIYGGLPDLIPLLGDMWAMVYYESSTDSISTNVYLNMNLQNKITVATSTGSECFPQIERVNSSYFVIVWSQGTSPKQVYGRVCSTSGCPTSAFRIDNSVTDNMNPKVTYMENDKFFAAWKTATNSVYGRVIHLNGTALTGNIMLLPSYIIQERLEVTSAIVSATRKWFLVYDNQGIAYMLSGDEYGTFQGPWQVSSSGGYQPEIRANGNLSIVYQDGQNIGLQFNNNSNISVCCGSGLYPNYPLSNSKYAPQITNLGTGKILVEWTVLASGSPLLWEQAAQIMYTNGSRYWTDDLRLNSISAVQQGNYGFPYGAVAGFIAPTVADTFAAAWTSYESQQDAIHFKVFHANSLVGASPSPTSSMSPPSSPSPTSSMSPPSSPSPTSSVSPSLIPSSSPNANFSTSPLPSSLPTPSNSPTIASPSPLASNSPNLASPAVSPSESPITESAKRDGSKKSNSGMIAGVVVGVIAGLGLLAGCFVVVAKKKRDQRDKQDPSVMELQSDLRRQDSANSITSTTTVSENSDKGWKIPYSDITIGQQLGRGAFGIVYQCTWRNTDCVIKLLNIEKEDGPAVKAFLREANNVRSLRNHPNICTIMGICTDPVAIVMEYVSGGSLLQCMASKQINLDVPKVIKFAKDIASGMSHLHAENIMHLDLACRNLLVAFGKNNTQQIKITDFGLSRLMDADTYTASEEATFPIRWTAPETLMMRLITRSSDVWSFGVTLWEIMERKIPYSDLPTSAVGEAVSKGRRLHRPTQLEIPDSLWNLILSCWEENIQLRPSFDQICATLKQIEAEVNPTPSKAMEDMNSEELSLAAISSSEAQVTSGSTDSGPYGNAPQTGHYSGFGHSSLT